MKKYLNILFTTFLFLFSFYYTNKISNFIKNKDPIMINILKNKEKYENDEINAIIENNTIITGKSSKKININKSYKKMKRINKYTPSLLVFDYKKPKISITNQYDKLIIQGNKLNKNISIVLKINDLNILKTLNNDYFNYILDLNFINENINYLKSLKNNIIIQEQSNINNINIIDYCYTDTIFNSYCSNQKKYTIKPIFITNNYFYNTFNILENGAILGYNILNENNIKDIQIVTSYIINLNYKLVTIDELLNE